MAALSAQLLIYALAWLVMGYGFRLKRAVALQWSLGWLSGAACTGIAFVDLGQLGVSHDLVINTLLVLAFMLLRRGVDAYTNSSTAWWEYLLLVLCVTFVELLRLLLPDQEGLRISIITVAVLWPLGTMAQRIHSWVSRHTKLSPGIMLSIVAPVLLTMGLFTLRPLLVVLGVDSSQVAFEGISPFAIASSLMFLLLLGAFNFSLASLVLGALFERLRRLSATDQLTGLANRRVMMHRLEEEHARFQRSGQVYAIVMMDLDNFKRVNDVYGHGVGDEVLRELARMLKEAQRRTDTLARVGGEEFMLLMPMTDTDGALVQARRFCSRVAQTKVMTKGGELQLTLSLGVAEVLAGDTSADVVVTRADTALYRAKAMGRNRVEFAERPPLPA